METFELKDNELLRQYQANIENKLVRLEYSDHGRTIFLAKLEMPKKLKDKGYTDHFIRAVIEDIKDKRQIKIMPTGKEVKDFFKKHRSDYSDLLPAGINL